MKSKDGFGKLGLMIFVLAVVSIIFQLQIVREILFMFGGNEIIYGVVIALWLLGFGVGAWFSSIAELSDKLLKKMILLEVLLPPFLIVLTRLIKRYWIMGIAKEFSFVILVSAIILFPFCLFSGFILAKASSGQKKRLVDVYFLDASGNLLGAFIFFFFLITLNTLRTALFISLLSLFVFWFISFFNSSRSSKKKRVSYLVLLVLVFLVAILSFAHYNLDGLLLSDELGELLEFKESKLGRIMVTESYSQRNYFYDGVPIGDNATESKAEMLTHLPISINEDADNFLLIKSFFSNELRELREHPGLNVSVVSPDESLVNEILEREEGRLMSSERIEIFSQDPYSYLNRVIKEDSTAFDIVVIGNPGIYSYRDNRLFSLEFFRMLRKVVSINGVVIVPVEAGENVITESREVVLSSVYNALTASFPNVIYIPGETVYFIASPGNLSYSFMKRLDEMNNSYADSMHLSPLLEERRMEMVNDSLSFTNLKNQNLKPVSFYYSILDWFELTGSRPLWIILILLGLTGFIIFHYDWSEAPLLTSGIMSSCLQVILVIVLSVSVGYGFYGMVLLTLFFMAGLWSGIFLAKRLLRKKEVSLKRYAVLTELTFISILALLLLIIMNLNEFVVYSILLFLIFLLDFLVGFVMAVQFSAIGSLRREYAPRNTFSADAVGAFLGAFLFSIFLIPFIGVINVFIILLCVKVIGLVGLGLAKKI